MNLVVKDRDTNHMMQLPLPIKQVIAGQLDEQGYLPVGVEAGKLQLVAEVLLTTSMKISHFNRIARIIEAMSDNDREHFSIAVGAFYPMLECYPESYVALAQAASNIHVYNDCSTFNDIGRKIDFNARSNREYFRAGLECAATNMVGFYGKSAVVLLLEDFDKAEKELSHDSDDCSEIETE